MTKLGIIGTALRRKNTEFDELCTKETYQKMLEIGRQKIKELNINFLVSGGAAFSDHITVDLFYDYLSKSDIKNNLYLKIFYPTKLFDTNSKIGKTINYYHKYFSNLIFKDENASIKNIKYLIDNYPNLVTIEEENISNSYSGFFTRNTKIANNSDYLLIFSYFNNGECLTNGSAHTIKCFLNKHSKDKLIKIDIRDLI